MNGGEKRLLIYSFNEACKNISSSYLRVGDQSISSISFCTKAKGYYLGCPIFYAIINHWGLISSIFPDLLLGPFFSQRYKEGSKGLIRSSNIWSLGQHQLVQILGWKQQRVKVRGASLKWLPRIFFFLAVGLPQRV